MPSSLIAGGSTNKCCDHARPCVRGVATFDAYSSAIFFQLKEFETISEGCDWARKCFTCETQDMVKQYHRFQESSPSLRLHHLERRCICTVSVVRAAGLLGPWKGFTGSDLRYDAHRRPIQRCAYGTLASARCGLIYSRAFRAIVLSAMCISKAMPKFH
jgi:hypothetical protein